MSYMENLKLAKNKRAMLLELKNQVNIDEFMEELEVDDTYFLTFLKDEDSKIRKLAAQILAVTEIDKYRDIILDMYLNEPQLMIRGALVRCLRYFDISEIVPSLEKEEARLTHCLDGEMSKHHKDELQALRQLLKAYRVLPQHTFTYLKKEVPMILLMPSGHQEVLIDELTWLDSKKVSLGVQVKTKDIQRLYESRLFSSIYFPLCKLPSLSEEAVKEGQVAKRMLQFLDSCHEGDFAYRFRVDCEDSVLAKKIAQLLEITGQSRLENHPGDYEIEIRLRKNKAGQGLVYLKLLTIEDRRFAYRQQISSTSVSGTTASLIAHYLQDYVQLDDKVLDPLCNDGTLLIERCKLATPHFVMGLDVSSEMMSKAKHNAQKANADIRFVQRDIHTFEHQKKFDEMITVLPNIHHKEKKESVERLYLTVFRQIEKLVNHQGIVALYSAEGKLIERCAKKVKYLNLKRKIPMIGQQYLYIYEVTLK